MLLPKFLGADLKNVQTANACPQASFDAAACPAVSRAGSVSATVSITDEVISGDVFLVTVPGQTLPGLGLVFTGRYAMRVLSTVRYSSDRLLADFASIPDLPITGIALTVDGGARGPLIVAKDDCSIPSFDTSFGAHGGQSLSVKQDAACGAGALKAPKVIWSKKKGLTVTLSDLGGRKLRSAKLTLPKGLTFSRGFKKKALVATLTGGAKPKLKRSKSTLAVSTKQNTATKLSIKIKPAALKRSAKKLKKGKRASFKLRLAFTDGTTAVKTVKVKAP